ncbi:hypothetical protein ETAA8_66890 [Anatilimnocola aggregata]|uniref:Transglutaminase-like domain-containing protein n=1 Tax=Anatilimnocola aggregata TaxID=2528021 RepID=A0A517YMS8_9BACT|nr:transglutaminase domain-containing protein [Anatilimnocola aggregata]QDU31530.1 hypothetical protein ETAA8_66890 [Anatilimnocola aggregata]
MKLSAAVVLTLVSLACTTNVRADEITLTAKEMFSRATPLNLRLSADGEAIGRLTGELIETDGNAAGYSYKPNEEVLADGIVIEKELRVRLTIHNKALVQVAPTDVRPSRAYLLVGHTGKSMSAEINGQQVPLGEPAKAGNYWKRFEVPVSALKDGLNSIKLRGDGKIWIARNDDHAADDVWKQFVEPSSFKFSSGGSPRSTKLGKNNDIEGEYYVRLYLEGTAHVSSGLFLLPMLDAANLAGKPTASPNAKVKSIRIKVTGDWGGLGSPAIILRAPPQTGHSKEFEFRADESEMNLLATSSKPLPQYFRIQLQMPSADATHHPQLKSITIATEIEAAGNWSDKLTLAAAHNPELPESLLPVAPHEFQFERLDHPRLQQLRKEYQLDEVVKGCTTDLQRMEKLAAWSSQLWAKGHLSEIYPKWDALEILKNHSDGTPIGGFCQQYNIVFLQACESLGMVGRCVSIGAGDHGLKIRSGHEVVEIWSNELSKWIYVDGQAAWYLVDKETREPLDLLELRARQVAHFQEKPYRAAEVVVLAKSPYEWKGFGEFPAFTELRMIPHTQFLDGKLPMPLNQGMRGWFWTGHRVWTDDLYPASVLYSHRITSPRDWNFPINQTHLWLEQKEKPGEVDVRLTHNMPSFEHFVVQIDGEAERSLKGNDLTWSLKPGENRVQVRAVNKLGIAGPPSWIKVAFKPGS